jgi:hypothetical protein
MTVPSHLRLDFKNTLSNCQRTAAKISHSVETTKKNRVFFKNKFYHQNSDIFIKTHLFLIFLSSKQTPK